MFKLANLGFCFQMLFFETIFAIYIPKRSKFPLIYGVGAVLMLLISYFAPEIFFSNLILFLFFIFGLFAMTVVFWVICLKRPFLHGFFVGIAGYSMQHLFMKLQSILFMFIYADDTENIIAVLIRYSIMLALGVVAYFLFARQLKNTALDLDKKKFLFISALVLVFMIIVSGSFILEGFKETIIIHVYAIFCCFLSLNLLMEMVKQKNLESELEIVNQLRHKEKAQYKISKENIDAINIKCHDLKNQLHAFSENSELNKTVLKDIESEIDIYDCCLKTGCDALDVVLAEKSFLCKKQNITLSCIADGEKLCFISDADIYSMFGNIMDNAIEAVTKLSDENERRISLRIKAVGNMLSICEENKFEGQLQIEDGLPVTTKKNKCYHGFGMRSIALTVEKYGGVLNLNTENELFVLDILFEI